MWLLILLAVHVNNPKDVPGKITLEIDSQQSCEQILSSMTFWLKFESFKVQGQCIKKS